MKVNHRDVTQQHVEMLSAAVRQHRLQLLCAWFCIFFYSYLIVNVFVEKVVLWFNRLLHFISSLDYYIMECVLETSHARLDSDLKNAMHLGEIAASHQKYITSVYSQCMQQPSAAFLRDPINEVGLQLNVFFFFIQLPVCHN